MMNGRIERFYVDPKITAWCAVLALVACGYSLLLGCFLLCLNAIALIGASVYRRPVLVGPSFWTGKNVGRLSTRLITNHSGEEYALVWLNRSPVTSRSPTEPELRPSYVLASITRR